MRTLDIVLLAVSAAVALMGFVFGKSVRKKFKTSESPPKRLGRLNILSSLMFVGGLWFFIVRLLTALFGEDGGKAARWMLFGHEISYFMFAAWAVMVALIIFALAARILVVPKLTDVPNGAQSFLEAAVEVISKTGGIGINLGTFILSVIVFIIVFVATKLWGISSPVFTLIIAAAAAGFGFLFGKGVKNRLVGIENPPKRLKVLKKLCFLLSLCGSWFFTVVLMSVIFGSKERGEFSVELSAEKWTVLGHSLSSTIIVTWAVMAVLILLALIVRIFVIPRFTDEPKGIQNLLETMVQSIDKYTDSNVKGIGVNLGAYIFTIAAFMVACAAVELLGIRSPTADLTMTAAMALITFVLINYYGIKRKGVGGRLKSLALPTPIVFPIRIICDCAIPVSLACRLFGNMLGGLIVMDLLYYALGSGAVGIPSVFGLYFNVFHPLIQAFIFVTLTLTFINEAVETTETD